MFRSFHMRTVGLALLLAVAAGCSSKKAAIYEHENFDDSGTFSRTYSVTDVATCEAGRRALLSQGYIITSSDPKLVSGHKSFQQTGDTHMEISFNLVCAEDGGPGHRATLFANALQDRYALKKTSNSASLGVGHSIAVDRHGSMEPLDRLVPPIGSAGAASTCTPMSGKPSR